MTRDSEGRWKSIEPTELHRNAILIGAITYYRDQLARRLIAKGYSILPAVVGRMQSFKIAGYHRRVRDAFSSRRKQIEAFMDERGWNYSQAAAQVAALATRKRKAEPLHAMQPPGRVIPDHTRSYPPTYCIGLDPATMPSAVPLPMA